ncbi:MAG: polymerase-associated helicase-like protein [Paenibacillus sp.]|nr:polymerase-associated helicase-like protein [Paenibacillus sp.]
MLSTNTSEYIRPIHDRLNIHFDRAWFEELEMRALKNGPWDNFTQYQLAYEAEQSGLVENFEDLQCLNHITHIKPLPHQIDTAKKVLFEMRGRAILADEVGLGKTIEAGLILKEYLIRGLVRKILILVPASLVLQWVRELNQKFSISAIAQKKEYMWEQYDVVVASMDTAKREPHRGIVTNLDYDMLVIDEAHKLKNKQTSNYKFVTELRKKYCLLLTATPIQNDLSELYNMITLLKPGQLGGANHFSSNYVVDKRVPKNEDRLQFELSKIMIRNRRGDGDMNFTKRVVKNIPLTLSTEEMALYQGVCDFVKVRYKDAEGTGDFSSMLSLVTLQREVCSSRDAVFITLVNMFKKTEEESPIRARIWELVELIKSIKANTKAEKTLEIIRGLEVGEKVIVFTEYRASQEYLLKFLKENNVLAVSYRGGMNRGKKDWMMDLFRNRAQVMVATEAGGEGINLQFCHNIINFDLPWNPMRVEQRIGRIHRLGQTENVNIFNLSTKGTIEEHILSLLHEKINMFELVIGGLDAILEQIEKSSSIESSLFKIIAESQTDDDVQKKLDKLSQKFNDIAEEVTNNPPETSGIHAAILDSVGQTIPSEVSSRL